MKCNALLCSSPIEDFKTLQEEFIFCPHHALSTNKNVSVVLKYFSCLYSPSSKNEMRQCKILLQSLLMVYWTRDIKALLNWLEYCSFLFTLFHIACIGQQLNSSFGKEKMKCFLYQKNLCIELGFSLYYALTWVRKSKPETHVRNTESHEELVIWRRTSQWIPIRIISSLEMGWRLINKTNFQLNIYISTATPLSGSIAFRWYTLSMAGMTFNEFGLKNVETIKKCTLSPLRWSIPGKMSYSIN